MDCKEGVNSKYSTKGVLIEEITYKHGMPNGLAKYFELNGDLKEAGDYKRWQKRREVWEYYMDGEVATEDQIKEEEKIYVYQKES